MREVKFRGKSEYKDVWHYGSLINNAFFLATDMSPVLYILDTDDLDYDDFAGIAEQLEHFKVIPESVGQYTGLKDKNGIEIYEGDIIKYIVKKPMLPEIHVVESIEDYREMAILKELSEGKISEIEVIGNTYENPELLEGDSDE